MGRGTQSKGAVMSTKPRKGSHKTTAKKKTAAQLLAAGTSVKATAQVVGLAPNTVSSFRDDPEFLEEFAAVLLRARETMGRRLATAADRAASVLLELLDDENPQVRLRAAVELADRCGLPAFKTADIATITGGEVVPDTVVRIEIPKGSM